MRSDNWPQKNMLADPPTGRIDTCWKQSLQNCIGTLCLTVISRSIVTESRSGRRGENRGKSYTFGSRNRAVQPEAFTIPTELLTIQGDVFRVFDIL
jgi:hypothetical protein